MMPRPANRRLAESGRPHGRLDLAARRRSLALLFALALVLRVGAFVYLRSYVEPQGWENEAIARSIATGHGFSFDYSEGYISNYYTPTAEPVPTSFQAPFYPYLLAVFYRISPAVGARFAFGLLDLLQSLAGAATTLVIFAVGRTLFDSRVAWLGALVFAVYPSAIFVATVPHQTVWVILFLALTVLAFLRLLEAPTRWPALWLGAAAGLCALTEPVVLVFLAPAAVWAVLRFRSGPLMRGLVAAGGLAVLILLPWQVRNLVVHRRFVLIKSSGPFVLWQGNNAEATGTIYSDWRGGHFPASPELKAEVNAIPGEIDRNRAWTREVWSAVTERPGRAAGLVLRKLLYYWTYAPFSDARSRHVSYWLPYTLLLPLAIYGLAVSRGTHPGLPLLYILFASFSVVYAIAYAGPRYRIPLEPYMMILGCYGLTWRCRARARAGLGIPGLLEGRISEMDRVRGMAVGGVGNAGAKKRENELTAERSASRALSWSEE